MFASTIIVFREVLEISLILSIVMAATKSVAHRSAWISGGITIGIAAAMLVAAFAQAIANFASGIGQELFNGLVLTAAVGMLAWHVIWMSYHGKKLADKMKTVGENVRVGNRPLSVLAVLAAVTVMREGSEIVLFMHGVAADGSSAHNMITGGIVGLAAASMLGTLIYFGLVRIPLGRLFMLTNTLILLIAAGMASKATGYFVQADIIPTFGDMVWDSSQLLPDSSAIGQFLSAFMGYTSRPSGVQLLSFLLTASLIFIGMGRPVTKAKAV